MNYTLTQIAEIVGGTLHGEQKTVCTIAIDTRIASSDAQMLFVALTGAQRDGHTYLEAAAKKGISAALVERLPSNWERLMMSFVVVADTLSALQTLAAHHRSTFKGEVVAITGSNGKTVVKEWFCQLWDEKNGRLFRSPRSYNSQIGVALSLLMISGDEKVAVIEAGISMRAEMERLEAMIRPTIGVLTNIGSAHAENFNSSQEQLAEKLRLFAHCPKIIRGDQLQYPTIDEHNLAIVNQIYSTLGITPLVVETLLPVALRLEVQQGILGSEVINDSYNNDLLSLSAALDFARRQSTRRSLMLVISDIEQSGLNCDELYTRLAAIVRQYRVDSLIGVGRQMRSHASLFEGLAAQFYGSTEELLSSIDPSVFAASTVLIKGARSFRLEQLSSRIEERTHTTTLEVNLSRMVENLNRYRAIAGSGCRVMAMVKASGYGTGTLTVARTLLDAGASILAVAFADEGVTLRRGGISSPIVVLNSDPGSFAVMIDNHLEPEIYSFASLHSYIGEIRKAGITAAPIHVKIDTGMHRLGFMADQIAQLGDELAAQRHVQVASIFTHLAASEEPAQDDFTRSQIAQFDQMSSAIVNKIGYRPALSIANTAGTERFATARRDIVRVGIGLYRDVVTLATKITQIKQIPAGDTIGYNRRTRAQSEMTIAIIPIGYADGMDRHLSCRAAKVAINGTLCDIVGSICMDTTIIDITKIAHQTKEGDRVEIIGPASQSAADLASIVGTIDYEILTSISPRIKRLYVW